MKKVIVESPFAGPDNNTVLQNIEFGRACLRDCLLRGEAPFASHTLYTQTNVLNDDIPEQRAKGMAAGWSWMAVADAVVVYLDRGISSGMSQGIARAAEFGIPVSYRRLDTPGEEVTELEGTPKL